MDPITFCKSQKFVWFVHYSKRDKTRELMMKCYKHKSIEKRVIKAIEKLGTETTGTALFTTVDFAGELLLSPTTVLTKSTPMLHAPCFDWVS